MCWVSSSRSLWRLHFQWTWTSEQLINYVQRYCCHWRCQKRDLPMSILYLKNGFGVDDLSHFSPWTRFRELMINSSKSNRLIYNLSKINSCRRINWLRYRSQMSANSNHKFFMQILYVDVGIHRLQVWSTTNLNSSLRDLVFETHVGGIVWIS